MNNLRNIAALLAFGVGSSACSAADEGEGTVVEVSHESPVGVTWEQYRNAALIAGQGNYYVVEWDLIFDTEAQLREYYDQVTIDDEPKLAVFQRLSTGFEPTYQGADAVDIVYCVSNSFANKGTVINDIGLAASSWQDVMNVYVRYDPLQDANCNQNNANVDFAVVPTTEEGLAGCGANKMLWSGGCPIGSGGTRAIGILSVNYGAFPLFPGLTGPGLFRHELGHVLGFRHEHPWAPNPVCAEPPTIAGSDITGRRLTAYDQASVMHYPECGGFPGTDFTITALDGEGGRSIYGMPVAWYLPMISTP